MDNFENHQVFMIIKGIEAIVNHNMRLTKIATPKYLRELAGRYTGKTYPSSRKGLLSAHADLIALANQNNP